MSTYVTYLRRKLIGDGPDLIHTQRAVGYMLRLPRPGDEASPGEVSPGGQAKDGQAKDDQANDDQASADRKEAGAGG